MFTYLHSKCSETTTSPMDQDPVQSMHAKAQEKTQMIRQERPTETQRDDQAKEDGQTDKSKQGHWCTNKSEWVQKLLQALCVIETEWSFVPAALGYFSTHTTWHSSRFSGKTQYSHCGKQKKQTSNESVHAYTLKTHTTPFKSSSASQTL